MTVTIHVEFVDAATGATFARSDVPIEQLPETFALATTMQLGDSSWQVERAEPATRDAFAQTRRLQLTLRKILLVDPKTIRFSLPTLEDALPPVQEGAIAAVCLHEDDWRQFELVAADHDAAIATELEAIREVIASKTGAGFDRIHVRSRISQPLAGVQLAITEVARALGTSRQDRLALGAANAIVDGGFAFEDGAVYGREQDSTVVVIGLGPKADGSRLAEVAKRHGLVLVDWCRATVRRF